MSTEIETPIEVPDIKTIPNSDEPENPTEPENP